MSSKTNQSRETFTRPEVTISHAKSERIIQIVEYCLTLALLITISIPLLWLFLSSIKVTDQLFTRSVVIIPDSVTLTHYVDLLTKTDFPNWFRNSLIIALGTTILATTLSTLGGYGLARASFKGKNHLARSVLLTYMYPTILLAIPLYIIFLRLELLNSYVAVILALTGRVLPFGLWLMWQQFQAVPMYYEESAWIDGASMTRTLFEVVLPMVFPAIAAVMIFGFALAWNQYTIPKVIATNPDLYPIPLGIDSFTQATRIEWNYVLSSSIVTIIPGFVIIVFLQKHFLRGFGLQ